MTTKRIPFTRPSVGALEERYLLDALRLDHLQGDGVFGRRVEKSLAERLGVEALLTPSGTAALEMAALLCDLGPGDEVIMPSFTFSSTANAVVLRGAMPVFVDIRPDTLNIDEAEVEAAITSKTRAIFPVHYAGVCAEMDAISAIARPRNIRIVEDAAQALGSTYRGRPVGTLGDLGCLSFHATKNVVSGEGGALLISNGALSDRAQIVREKGTNRRAFLGGAVDKYTWVDVGSSFLPGEIVAALLLAQVERADEINAERLSTWNTYHSAFEDVERGGLVRRPIVPVHCGHNAHMYYLLVARPELRSSLIRSLAEDGITAPFHYVPLHSAPAGRRFGRSVGDLPVTTSVADRLIRLPLYVGMGARAQRVIDRVLVHLESPG